MIHVGGYTYFDAVDALADLMARVDALEEDVVRDDPPLPGGEGSGRGNSRPWYTAESVAELIDPTLAPEGAFATITGSGAEAGMELYLSPSRDRWISSNWLDGGV